MKKHIVLCLMLIVVSVSNLFAAKKSIVCTSYPEYDWVMNILKNSSENFDVTLLQNKGTDLHSYQPSIKDIAKISTCDLFIYVGGESDKWVEAVITNSKNPNMQTVNLLESLGERIKEEEIVEGMQPEEEESEEDEVEYDEHVWLSLRNAVILVHAIEKKISILDQSNSNLYEQNARLYVNKLNELDKQYEEMVTNAARKVFLVCDRFPFRYLADDYDLKYYAAFVGCSAESEASFETIRFLAGKVDELDLSSILVLEKSQRKIANTVISSAKRKNVQILEIDSLQSVTQKEIQNGRTYYSVMENNLMVLRKALN